MEGLFYIGMDSYACYKGVPSKLVFTVEQFPYYIAEETTATYYYVLASIVEACQFATAATSASQKLMPILANYKETMVVVRALFLSWYNGSKMGET